MVRLMRLTALLLCAAACGNPDNLVIGGISATATIPVALIDNVRSAISGIATYNKSGQQISQRTVVILSNTGKLCDQLGASGFAIETARFYGTQRLLPRRRAFFATRIDNR